MNIQEYNTSVEKYSDGVYRFLLKNCRDKDTAKDLVQDTFEKLWIKRKNIDFNKVKSYIFSTAYHTFIDLTRREKKLVDFENVNSSDYKHEEQYSDLQEILHKALQKLSSVQKSVILLRDYEGYSYDEISKITKLTESQVKVYIYRGRKFLQQYIGSMQAVM